MTKNIRHLLITFLAMAFIASGCQKEIDETIEPTPQDVFSAVSNVADLIKKTALRDGSGDNIIDGTSCSSIALPITVKVNGLEIILDEVEDFETVENIIDKFDDDDDIIEIFFPVKVILADHSEVMIDNMSDLDDLAGDCTEGGLDDDIECIDFKYPVSIAMFDSKNQVSDVVTIENDKHMHDFIDDLKDDDIASFNFPIKVVLADGNELTINNHDQLEDALKNAVNDCDEDDDNDHDEDDVDDSELVHVLLQHEWMITYFFDDKDETADFSGYAFTFFENGMLKAKKGEQVVEGTWSSNGDDGELEVELNFGDDVILLELNDDWDVIEFATGIIKLKDVSGGDGSVEYLTFEKYEHTGGGGSQDDLSTWLMTREWKVANYNDSGEDKTNVFVDYTFKFMAEGKVTATKGNDTIEGTWSTLIDSGIENLTLNFGTNQPLDEFSDDWDVENKREDRIELKDVSGGDGSTDKLVFERI